MSMDTFVDERDFSLLEHDRYTFFVLRRITGGSCHTLLSNHENLIICYTGEPYPVWIWTADSAETEIMEKAYRLAAENGFVNNGQRFNVKYDLAEYMIRRAAEDGKELSVSTNMFAYDCPDPVAPSVKADGDIHRCTAEDLDELAEFLDAFHQEIEIDRKEKTITKATICLAFHTAVEIQKREGYVSGPKKIGGFGASYLYPMFLRFGVIREMPMA